MCGKYVPLMPGIFLKGVFNIRAMNESPIWDLRYYWMTDNDTSCRSQNALWCMLRWWYWYVQNVTNSQMGNIWLLAKYPRTNCNGGSRMMQFDGFGFMMRCINPHVTNLMLANCNSTLGHQTTNLILLMRDSVWPLCVWTWDTWWCSP